VLPRLNQRQPGVRPNLRLWLRRFCLRLPEFMPFHLPDGYAYVMNLPRRVRGVLPTLWAPPALWIPPALPPALICLQLSPLWPLSSCGDTAPYSCLRRTGAAGAFHAWPIRMPVRAAPPISRRSQRILAQLCRASPLRKVSARAKTSSARARRSSARIEAEDRIASFPYEAGETCKDWPRRPLDLEEQAPGGALACRVHPCAARSNPTAMSEFEICWPMHSLRDQQNCRLARLWRSRMDGRGVRH